jgi:hypothetical protein
MLQVSTFHVPQLSAKVGPFVVNGRAGGHLERDPFGATHSLGRTIRTALSRMPV